MTTASRWARSERDDLCDLFLEVGPDAPTLCAGWTARDLAAHLVVREGRPDASAGLVIPALAPFGERIRRQVAQRPWPALVATIRSGPPLLSPLRAVDGLANALEFTIHHEDVRRGGTSWSTREIPDWAESLLWRRLSLGARMFYRNAPVDLVLTWVGRADVPPARVARGAQRPTVTLTGRPVDLLLHAFGRSAVLLDISGDTAAVQALEESNRGA